MLAVCALGIVTGALPPLGIPRSFVRVSRPAPSRVELQTLSITVELPSRKKTVQLVATVHVAEAGYYQSILADSASADFSLCELVVPESCLTRDELTGVVRLRQQVAPSAEQQRLAAQLGLVHQLDGLPYGTDRLFSAIADVALGQLLPIEAGSATSPVAEVARTIQLGAIRGAALGAARARQGPSLPQQLLRSMAWLVPCPEISLLVLDWAWSRTRPQVSSLLRPLGRALVQFDLRCVRRLAFAQVLLSSSAEGGGATGLVFAGGGAGARVGARMSQRNTAALDALEAALARETGGRLVLFYGPAHLDGPSGIVSELLRGKPDARIVETAWRTAFVAELDSSKRPADGEGPERLLLPMYLAIFAFDWWITVEDMLNQAEQTAAGSLLVLTAYVVRHGVLYWSLSRWALDWSGRLEEECE